MNISAISQIEETFSSLSPDEQQFTIKKLSQHFRTNLSKQTGIESQFEAMAKDTEIQNELKKINEEFAFVEDDGLEHSA
jgi:hypothetical protein